MADLYEILGVTPHASSEEIKRAFRQKAREHHPDANPDDPAAEEQFKAVTAAYEVLSDPDRRRRYDTYGDEGRAGADAGFGIGDLFETIFGGDPFGRGSPFGGGFGGPRGPEPGADIGVDVELSFVDAVYGTERDVAVRVRAACETCEATGAAPGTEAALCSTCGGRGEVQHVRRTMLGQMVTAGPCSACQGTGKHIASPCPECRGEGRSARVEHLAINVPAGVDEGARLRMSGRGDVGRRGGGAGDLYVRFHVATPPEGWLRDGDELHRHLSVPMTTAALGGRVVFETLTGDEVEVDVMPGTTTGERIRYRGQGVPHLRGAGNGDLIVTLLVETPANLDDESEELLRRLAEIRGENTDTPGMISRIRNVFR